MDCWKVTDDINMVTKYFIDNPKWEGMSGELSDAMMNKYFAIAELYEIKFQKLFDTFVDCIPDLKDSIENNLQVYVFDDEDEDSQMSLRLNDVPPEGWDNPSAWDKATRG